MKQGERHAIERHRKETCMKKELLWENKFLAAQKEYASDLTYIEMYHSQDCWRSEEDVARQFAKLRSNKARVNAVKEQIIIR